MAVQEFLPKPYAEAFLAGRFTWTSPSNIALVKYWGKKNVQIPENPSISFTLDACKTVTTVEVSERKACADIFSFEMLLDGEKKEGFNSKVTSFFDRVVEYLPFLKQCHLTIETTNTFPHSSGIASSASGISALALCLMSVEQSLLGYNIPRTAFVKKASFLARLGSGSACRSIEGGLVVWGAHSAIVGSSDNYGIRYPHAVHELFKTYRDTILLVDTEKKHVSSTVGHQLMYNHPFAKERFKQAYNHLEKLKGVLETGDIEAFISIVESEALALHAMMMTSHPSFILMKPNTLEIINSIWDFRKRTHSNLCFTLDAGANIHVLYPQCEAPQVLKFIRDHLIAYCSNAHYICDAVGNGARQQIAGM